MKLIVAVVMQNECHYILLMHFIPEQSVVKWCVGFFFNTTLLQTLIFFFC